MVVIYGWKTEVKKDKQLGVEHCENCKHDEETFLAREILKMHIFGVPVFRKTKRRFIMCNNCGIVQELGKEEYKSKLN